MKLGGGLPIATEACLMVTNHSNLVIIRHLKMCVSPHPWDILAFRQVNSRGQGEKRQRPENRTLHRRIGIYTEDFLKALVSTTLQYLMERNEHFKVIFFFSSIYIYNGMTKLGEWNLPVHRLQVTSMWLSQCAFFVYVHYNNLIPQVCNFRYFDSSINGRKIVQTLVVHFHAILKFPKKFIVSRGFLC